MTSACFDLARGGADDVESALAGTDSVDSSAELACVTHVAVPRSRAISDFDRCAAAVEIHEGFANASLQIATTHSYWLLLAARPPIRIETIDATLTLSIGDAFVLPAGMPALLEARGSGAWLALRFVGESLSVSPAAGRDRARLALGQDVMLARAALELSDARRQATHPAVTGAIAAGLRRLGLALTRFQRIQTARAARHCSAATAAQCEQWIELLQRMRLAAVHGDGAESVLQALPPAAGIGPQQLRALYAASFRADARRLAALRPPAAGSRKPAWLRALPQIEPGDAVAHSAEDAA